MAHKTLVNGTAHEISGGKTMVAGTAYTIKSGRTLVGGTGYNLSFLPPVGTPLEDFTWEQISIISTSGLGSTYFSVGDMKSVYLSGTIGTLEIAATLYVYILGFDHNSSKEGTGITFGTFKDADGTDVCLIDSRYNGLAATGGTKYFNMNHDGASSYLGWKGCDLRYDVLGSTNTYGADAGITTATSPVAGTLMAAFPLELRLVMKPMTIYTDNTGGGEDISSNVTASVDYLPLLAECEVFSTRSNSNSAEKNYQQRYAYFSDGNSVKKHSHTAINNPCDWWTRSPKINYSDSFCGVSRNGTKMAPMASYSEGLAPIFRV